jgi:tight adherence protein C
MMTRLFLTLILNILISASWGQDSVCTDDFDTLDTQCINRYRNSMQSGVIVVDEKIIDKAYFYTTSLGNIGKLIFQSYIINREECSVYYQATTYTNKGSFAPPGTLSIAKQYNVWEKDSESLDQRGRESDLTLEVVNGQCVIKTAGAKLAAYKVLKDERLSTGSDILYYAALFLIGLAVFLVANSIFSDESKFKTQEALEDASEDEKPKVNDFILKYSRPFFKRYFSPIVKGMKNKKRFRDKYKRKLATAGLTQELTPEDFFAFKLFLILGFPILYLVFRTFLEADWPLALTPGISALGFIYPDIWINGKIQKRREALVYNMPFIVDMLALSVEAGLDFMAAIVKVVEKAPPSPLSEEFITMIKETKIGASRAEGLRQLSWRTDSLPVASFCATLIAADSVGANIGPILKNLSVELRQKRSSEAEKKGATAATKILFPMMLFIMPAVGIMIMAPIGLQLMMGK